MIAARLCALLFAAATLPVLGPIHYAPTTQHYRLHSTVRRIQEQNGQKADATTTQDQLMTVAIRGPAGKSALGDNDTLQLAVSLDSINMSTTLSIPLPDVSVMQGTKVVANVLPSGKVIDFKSDTKAEDGVDRESIVSSMAHFLLPLPDAAKTGTNWTDTANANVSKDGSTLQTKTITTSSILGDTTYAGQKAWRVRRQSVLQMSGSQKQPNQTITMEGAGTGEGMYYIGSNGVYLGSTASQSMKMTLMAAGTVIPVTQTAIATVEIAR